MTTASKITLVRVAMIPAFMLAFLLSPAHPWLKWLALGIFILASLTDYVDGHIARKYNQVSDFGKFLDPLADKLLVISAMCIFCQWGLMPAWALMIVLTREFAVTGLRLIAVGKGRVIAAGWSGKVKTFSTMVALCIWIVFHDWAWLNWVIILVIVLPTLYSGVEYFMKNWDVLELKKR
ncbi:MAG: CDP-diacylglycerol--glycerol-3-phosphate 3-phosphatidyltransferase [Oscillospiraceae bacterium]|nr:CDP-diacylglycerol--glycerol-3-phosphate 3-phosphatidyltransferase [Oscillospiraceae bacterium]MBR4194110.1 CDP-diacylglycerol--glycerol-3-phosphate 3-phosphatidyltransferase [Oscillospiraceae bacterium]